MGHKSVNLNLNAAIAKSPAKSIKPLKKVDLGAAANFGVNSPTSTATKDDFLADDFDPRALDNVDSKPSEFGDFENAFASNEPEKPADDFADFSSAFQQTNHQNMFPTMAAPSVQNQILLDPLSSSSKESLITEQNHANFNAQINSNLVQQPNLFPVPPATNQNANDLLLSDFGSLSVQSNNVNLGTSTNGNVGALQPPNLLDGFSGGKINRFINILT